MRCPQCGAITDVKETRTKESVITRRRICHNYHTFKTEERCVTEPTDVRPICTSRPTTVRKDS